MKAPFPIPTGLQPSARGCAPRATLGHAEQHSLQPQRGCVRPWRIHCHNPVGVDSVLSDSPRVARASQPWANRRYPVGVFPPLAEQTQIAAEVERRLSAVDELESVVSANLQRATRLRQSILQKPFTGELTETGG
jgi:hypothetical protein